MESNSAERRQAIQAAIATELARQCVSGIDVDALAQAIDQALGVDGAMSEGKRPEDLNATNDD